MLEHVRTASRTRRLAMTVFVVVMVVVFVLLGRWQLDRAHSQNLEDAARDTALAAAPLDASGLPAPGTTAPTSLQWRTVTATGTYDVSHQLLVRNRSLDSTNGYLVLVPLRTANGDLLVVRGWIPAGPTAAAPSAVPALPQGVVSVSGRFRLAEPSAARSGLPAGQVERIAPEQVAVMTGRPTYDGWLSLQSEDPTGPAEAGLRTLPADGSSGWRWPISHTVYAMQWFTFGVIAVVGWFVLLRRDIKDGTSTVPASSGGTPGGTSL